MDVLSAKLCTSIFDGLSVEDLLLLSDSPACCNRAAVSGSFARSKAVFESLFGMSVKAPVHEHTHTHLFNGLLSGTTRVSRYQKLQKGKNNLDFTGARYTEWQWHQLGHMQVCTSLQTDNHASTLPLCFLQAGCPSCRPTNSVKALKPPPVHEN